MLLNQNVSQSEQVVCCGKIFQIVKDIKISEQVKKYLYNWILQHPQVVQSPIADGFLKVSIDGNSEPQLVPEFLLQVSVW